MDRSDIRMLDLDRVDAALSEQSEFTRVGGCGAQEHDGDLEPGRVLGTVERSEGGVPPPLMDADPGTEGPAHQAGLGARTRARVVLGSALDTAGRAQQLFSRWSLVAKLITMKLRELAKYRIGGAVRHRDCFQLQFPASRRFADLR
jgi:hypothetical protein